MPYRDESEALSAQRKILEVDLERARERAAQLHEANAEVQQLERQLAAVIKRANAVPKPRAKSPLDDIKIASPCNVSWDSMAGSETVRHCGQCDKDVFNLSAMPREKAEALLVDRSGNLCVRLYRRKDGTVLTADCPDGLAVRNRRRVVLTVLSAAALAGVGIFVGVKHTQSRAIEPKREPAVSQYQPPKEPDNSPLNEDWKRRLPPAGYSVHEVPRMMGAVSLAPVRRDATEGAHSSEVPPPEPSPQQRKTRQR